MSEDNLKEHYIKDFKGTDYYSTYYKELSSDVKFWMTHYYNAFSKASELMKRDPDERTILDLGSGPVPIYAAAAVAASYSKPKSITYSDFVPESRFQISLWMEKAKDALDWTPHFKLLEKLSGKSSSDIQDETRLSFKEVLPCDIKLPIMPIPGMESNFDIITTNVCLEGVCNNIEEWKTALRNIGKMLKPGGLLLQGGIRNLTKYEVGDTDFPSMAITEEVMKKIFEDDVMPFKLLVENWKDLHEEPHEGANHDGLYFLMAKKVGH